MGESFTTETMIACEKDANDEKTKTTTVNPDQ
jgi:hypothetical protein